jgi:4-amino-4-deoxy-L-arabinose transferase-like glycosyltransferase
VRRLIVPSRALSYFLLVLLSLMLFAPGQASLPPLDRDESRYAQATTQMFETGNFVDIRFQDQPRYLQPAGVYWLQAASVSLLSSPEAREIWAYRIPSLLGATVAVLLTAWIGNLLFGEPTGLVAAVLLAISLILGPLAKASSRVRLHCRHNRTKLPQYSMKGAMACCIRPTSQSLVAH